MKDVLKWFRMLFFILLSNRLGLLFSFSFLFINNRGEWLARRNTTRLKRVIMACWVHQLFFGLSPLKICIKKCFRVGCEQLFMRTAYLERLFYTFVNFYLSLQIFLRRRALNVFELFVFQIIDFALWTGQDIAALRDDFSILSSIIFSSFFGVRLTHILVRCFNPK